MKIGLLTFHCAHNYGAVLQCYALQETLISMGHEVEVINYRPKYLIASYKRFELHRFISLNLINSLKNSIKEALLAGRRFRRYKAFEEFITNRLNLSERVNANNIPSKYDIYIIGSDQIWNPKITKGFDSVYWGQFTFPKERRRYIAYAASMEIKRINEGERIFCKESLRNFDAISVREFQLVNLLQPLTNKKIETVLDPTLLADSSMWNKIAKKPNISQKYVLVYQIRSNQKTLQVANKIACQLNAAVIEVSAWPNIHFKRNVFQCASPEEFLGLIKYSSCVVTTSFHGTAFSIIFRRPFYCIKLDDGGDTRSMSLLKNIGLEERMIYKDYNPIFSEVNYLNTNKMITDMRDKSKNFLLNAIGK